METECLEIPITIEQPDAETKPKKITVLIKDGVTVTKDAMEYTVSGGDIKNSVSHMRTFVGAMQEVSDRLFLNKLTRRAEEGRNDFESLVRLVEAHKKEMKEKFNL